MSVEGDVMRIQKKLSKMSSSDGEVSEYLMTWTCFDGFDTALDFLCC